MKKVKQHIIFKFITLVLALTLIIPSFVKLAHAFENHKHEVCKTPQKKHFHEFNIDCEFYKFKLNTQYLSNSFYKLIVVGTQNNLEIISQYHFLSDFQKLPFALRGPPSLV